MKNKNVMIVWLLSAAALCAQVATAVADTVVVGAGAHFSWVIFDGLKAELEEASGARLDLHGEMSLLGVGCNAGIKTALKNSPDYESFGFTCCPISDDEIHEKQIIVHRLAYEPVLVVTNANNPVKDLSLEQVRGIFSGNIVNWSEVGGPDKPIVVVARLHCKNREGHWKTILPDHKAFSQKRINVKSALEMNLKIAQLDNAIGHVGSAWEFQQRENINVISVGGHAPTAENLRLKRYPFYRELSAITNMTPSRRIQKIISTAKNSESFRTLAAQYQLLPITD